MQRNCTIRDPYVSPFSVRRWNRDLRPPIRDPLFDLKKAFYAEANIKSLTTQAIALADRKGIVSSRVAQLDVRKAVDRAWVEYTGSIGTELKKNFDEHVAQNTALKPGATLRSLIKNKSSEMNVLNARALKHVRMTIHERLMTEKRARQLKIGVYSQAGLIGRPHRPSERSQNLGRRGYRDIQAGGVKESGIGSIGNLT